MPESLRQSGGLSSSHRPPAPHLGHRDLELAMSFPDFEFTYLVFICQKEPGEMSVYEKVFIRFTKSPRCSSCSTRLCSPCSVFGFKHHCLYTHLQSTDFGAATTKLELLAIECSDYSLLHWRAFRLESINNTVMVSVH